MTQAIDPFAQADGSISTNPNAAPADDPFGQPGGGGDYPKPLALLGSLLMLSPVKIEEVPDKFSDKPNATTFRLTANTVVLTGELAGQSYHEMYWSQKPIVTAARRALDEGVPSILGTLVRVPIGQDKKENKYPTLEAFEKALEDWRPKDGAVIRSAWVLQNFTPEQRQIALDYLANKGK